MSRYEKWFDGIPNEKLMLTLKNIRKLKGKIEEWMKDYLEGTEVRTLV